MLEAVQIKKDRLNNGFKILTEGCELLDNLTIKDIQCNIQYPLDRIVTRDRLENWMTTPDNNDGVEFIFDCILYNKEVKIRLSGTDHADYKTPLTTNWKEALKIVIEAMYEDESLSNYIKLPELENKTIKEYISNETGIVSLIVTRDLVVLKDTYKPKNIAFHY